MGSHEEGSKPYWPCDRNNVLYRVGVDGNYPSWSGPLVVDLVAMLVEFWMVKEPVCVHNT